MTAQVEHEPYRTRIRVRHYELDTNGHLNHAIYHSYGEVARLDLWEHAGATEGGMRVGELSPVLLASQISYRRELRGDEVVVITCGTKFGGGKTFQMSSFMCKEDGTLAAEIVCTLGLMDLGLRRLVEDPKGRFEDAGVDTRVLINEE